MLSILHTTQVFKKKKTIFQFWKIILLARVRPNFRSTVCNNLFDCRCSLTFKSGKIPNFPNLAQMRSKIEPQHSIKIFLHRAICHVLSRLLYLLTVIFHLTVKPFSFYYLNIEFVSVQTIHLSPFKNPQYHSAISIPLSNHCLVIALSSEIS